MPLRAAWWWAAASTLRDMFHQKGDTPDLAASGTAQAALPVSALSARCSLAAMGLLHEPSFRLFLGVALVIYGCWNSAMGMAFIKQSSDVERDRRCICRPRFWIGTLILLGNSAVVDLITFSLLPISMIAPFAGLTIVFSLIIASTGCLGPKETITLTDAMHISLVLIGVTVVSLFGPQSGVAEVRYEQIMSEFKSAGFILYAAINLGIVSLWVVFTCVPSLKRHLPSEQMQGQLFVTVFSAYAAPTCGALSKIFLKAGRGRAPVLLGQQPVQPAGAVRRVADLRGRRAAGRVRHPAALPAQRDARLVARRHRRADVPVDVDRADDPRRRRLLPRVRGGVAALALRLHPRRRLRDRRPRTPLARHHAGRRRVADAHAEAEHRVARGLGRACRRRGRQGALQRLDQPIRPAGQPGAATAPVVRQGVPLPSAAHPQVALGLTAMYEAARDAAAAAQPHAV